MKSRSLFNKTYWKNYATPFNLKELLDQIESSDKKVADRQRLGEETAKKKAAERRKKQNEEAANRQQRNNTIKRDNAVVNRITPKAPISKTKPTTRIGGGSIVKTVKKK